MPTTTLPVAFRVTEPLVVEALKVAAELPLLYEMLPAEVADRLVTLDVATAPLVVMLPPAETVKLAGTRVVPIVDAARSMLLASVKETAPPALTLTVVKLFEALLSVMPAVPAFRLAMPPTVRALVWVIAPLLVVAENVPVMLEVAALASERPAVEFTERRTTLPTTEAPPKVTEPAAASRLPRMFVAPEAPMEMLPLEVPAKVRLPLTVYGKSEDSVRVERTKPPPVLIAAPPPTRMSPLEERTNTRPVETSVPSMIAASGAIEADVPFATLFNTEPPEGATKL